jgi:hypothetical protein
MSLMAVAFALLVLELLELAVEPVGAVVPDSDPVLPVALGADAVVELLGALVTVLVTAPLVPLAAVPDPMTVPALTVVDPEVFTLPGPVFVASTVVVPAALVVACAVLATAGAVPVPVLSTGPAVPLAATPDPTTVAAFMVVEPAALTAPAPLLVAFTVVDPVALVIAVCALAGLPRVRLSNAALTAAATVLRCCSLLVVI